MVYFTKKAQKEIIKYLELNHNKIDVLAGQCRFNQKCHMNAVHDAVVNGEKRIALIMCVDRKDNCAYIHFINVKENGVFVDNTLGYWVTKHDNYFIRYIERSEFDDITDVFIKFRESLHAKLSFFSWLFTEPQMF